MNLHVFIIALLIPFTIQQRTRATTTTTTELPTGIEAKCSGNWCTTPRPCTGFGCPPTTTEKAYPIPPTPLVNRALVAFNVGNDISGIHGYLELAQDTQYAPVRINGTLHGLIPSKRLGFHIHQSGDIREGCSSTGNHFNFGPLVNHGIPGNMVRHVGDLGNIQTNSYGIASISMSDSMISLNGERSVVGRTFVIHEKEDDAGRGVDQESRVSGNSGMRMACGIVGILGTVQAPY